MAKKPPVKPSVQSKTQSPAKRAAKSSPSAMPSKSAPKSMPGKSMPGKASKPSQVSGKSSGQKNEGEGNKTAARHYNANTEKFVKAGKVAAAAKAAEKAIDGPEGKSLRQAEKEGLKHSRN